MASSYGGSATINSTNFANAGDPLFKTPPGCLFLHQASFITGLGAFKTAKSGTDYNFFPFPDINRANTGAVEGAGDLFGMFHDTPAAKSLMAYLVTAPAQDIWVKLGGAISANKNATDYPDDISKRSADLLSSAKIFVFDASDLMPSAMNDAFWKAIVNFVKDPSKLDSILAGLDTAQKAALRPVAPPPPAGRSGHRSLRPGHPLPPRRLHMDPRLITAVIVVLGVPTVLVGYIVLTEQVLRLLPGRIKPRIRPWLWLAPALMFLVVFLVYPTIGTIIRSFQDKAGTQFVGLDNYAWFFSNGDTLGALKNNLIWLVLLTLLCVGLGLLIAVLVDRVRYESIAKSLIFVPLAISMVAAGVIWKFMFDYQPPGQPQTGTLNAARSGSPVSARCHGSRSPTSASTRSCSSSSWPGCGPASAWSSSRPPSRASTRSCWRRPASTAPPSGRSSAGSSSRSCCRRSPSCRRRWSSPPSRHSTSCTS